MRFHRLPAIGETIFAEFDAYRLEREHADLFDHPGEGLAWMKQSIRDSMIGILGAGLRFDGRPTPRSSQRTHTSRLVDSID